MKRARVLFVITYYYPYISGLTIYIQRLSENLAKKGTDCTVLCMQHDENLSNNDCVNGVTIKRASVLLRLGKGCISSNWIFEFWQLAQINDIILINLPQVEGAISACIGKMLNKKIVSIYHCDITLPSSFLNLLTQIVIDISSWITMTLSDKIVTNTKDY